MEPQLSPAALALVSASYVASLSTLLVLAQRYFTGRPILEYEPRRRVPWSAGVAILAMVIPVMGVVFSAIPLERTTEVETAYDSFILQMLSTCVVMIAFVAAVGFFLHVVTHANAYDMGLPKSFRQLVDDICLGIVGCAAALLPIYVIHYVLHLAVSPEEEHPVIEELQHSPTTGMLLTGLLTVAVAAPLFEEFTFRLLLQGWLEKWEDEQIGYGGSQQVLPPPSVESLDSSDGSETVDTEEAEEIELTVEEPSPPHRGILPDLQHGCVPILISSTLFGLAHLGHGVSPVPLVLFGIILGYLYQRTHRIVPSMTAHALFNSYSMAMLWLSV
jgi:membrane protease YdiL (CAAX protease family)